MINLGKVYFEIIVILNIEITIFRTISELLWHVLFEEIKFLLASKPLVDICDYVKHHFPKALLYVSFPGLGLGGV